MIIPDFRDFRNRSGTLRHSAKGSEWDDHKYVKKIDGVYYYPVGYEDGRTVDSLGGEKKSEEKKEKSKEDQISEVKQHFDQYLAKRGIDWRTLPKDEIDQMQRDIIKQLESGKDNGTSEKSVEELAKDVISGKLGSGEDRKALLGDNYQEIQNKVNELMKSSKKISEVSSEEIKTGKEVTKKATEKVTQASKGLNLDQVYSVYRKKK